MKVNRRSVLAMGAAVPLSGGLEFRAIAKEAEIVVTPTEHHPLDCKTFHARYNGVCGREGTLTALYEIEGVESVTWRKYRVIIEKAHLYSWDEVEPKVIAILQEAISAPVAERM